MSTTNDERDPRPAQAEDLPDRDENEATETSPLLGDSRRDPNTHSTNSLKKPQWQRRWPSILALAILCLLVLLIIIFAFFAPSIVERYAKEAAVFEPTSLSIDGFTDDGVRARVQGDFSMEASRVKSKSVRDLGRAGMWIARYAESGASEVEISLPEMGNLVLGTADVGGVVVDVRSGHVTHVDVLADVRPGNKEGLRRLANDWMEGRLGRVRVLAEASVPVKSGLFGFGKQNVRREMVLEEGDVPSLPEYDIRKVDVHDVEGLDGMEADVQLSVDNPYPVEFEVPRLGFEILVDNCRKSEPYISVAKAVTEELHVKPKKNIKLDVTGLVRQLPDMLIQDCPHSDKSPLDIILGNYMRGKENTIYVRGSEAPGSDTPKWMEDLISDIVVPVPLPGKTMGHLIKNFSLADTHFNLPDPFADPNTPDSQPRISAKVRALIALPEEMNFNISANRVRADADVFYKKQKLGVLDLKKWQKANSTRIEHTKDEGPSLLVESVVDKAPLKITNEQVFADVIQDLVFGGKSVVMSIKADVDVEVETALGEFKVRGIPAEGQVPVKPPSSVLPAPDPGHGDKNNTGGNINFGAFAPKILDLNIINTTRSSLTLSALLNLTNPTNSSATIPYLDIHITKNDSLLGHATIRNMAIHPGVNPNLLVSAVYNPLGLGGKEAKKVGRELLSQYISGFNTTISLQLHAGSLPTLPRLGEALSNISIEVPAPKLRSPKTRPPPSHDPTEPPNDDDDEGDGRPHFIEDATMHLLTSTATFTLLSPLRHSILYITDLDATALYHNDTVGHISYGSPFPVPPVDEEGNGVRSPRLPVEWSLGSVGYEAVKNALGGTLRLSARAVVGVRIGEWRDRVWFVGGSIGAKVRL